MKDRSASHIQEVEREVLRVYQAQNPSTYYIESNPALFETKRRAFVELFRDHLQFPPRMFNGAKVLEFGGGTGERSLLYNEWGAHLTVIEMNPLAVARAQHLFRTLGNSSVPFTFINASLFEAEIDESFDIVACNGVLHHTGDKEGGFARLIRHLAPGGYVFLGIGNAAGSFQDNLKRAILYRLADSEHEIERIAEMLFKEHIDRAELYGLRERRAIIYDSFINPKIDCPSVRDVLGWFQKHNLRLYSTWPKISPPQLADSGMQPHLDIRDYPACTAFAELFWLSHTEDDKEALSDFNQSCERLEAGIVELAGYLADVTPDGTKSMSAIAERAIALKDTINAIPPFQSELARTTRLMQEIKLVADAVQTGDEAKVASAINSCRVLFRGTNGIGMTYYMGFKEG